MNLSVALLFLGTICYSIYMLQAADLTRLAAHKRTLAEGNAGIEKRAPLDSTATPPVTPGVQYATTSQLQRQSDKSPSQQTYPVPTKTETPQIAKISDVLSGQGQPFFSTIASHLYSPVSVYQPRLSSPTTYSVSPPVPAQLAYTEQSSFLPKLEYNPEIYNTNQKPVRLQAPPQPVVAQPVYQPSQVNQPQPLYHQQAQVNHQIYQQAPQVYPIPVQYPVQNVQLVPYQNQYYQPLVQVPQNVQPGIVYANEGPAQGGAQNVQQPAQRPLKDLKIVNPKAVEKPASSAQNYNNNYNQLQGAVSYASFSQSQPAATYNQQQTQNQAQSQKIQQQQQYQAQTLQQQHYQAQNQQTYQPAPQLQLVVQPNYQPLQPQPFQLQPQPQSQTQSQTQSQSQYSQQSQQSQSQQQANQSQSQFATTKLEPLPANSAKPNQVAYFRPNPVQQPQFQIQQIPFQLQGRPVQFQAVPVFNQYQPNPQYYQPQVFAGPISGPEGFPVAVAPTFAPVQYYGKFAQSIFGSYPIKK